MNTARAIRVIQLLAVTGTVLILAAIIGATDSILVLGYAALAVGMTLIWFGYFLIDTGQRLLEHADQQQGVIDSQLARIPSKSAPRTEAPADARPHTWWTALRKLEADALPATPAEPEQPAGHPMGPGQGRRVLGRARLRAFLAARAARTPVTAPGPATAHDLRQAATIPPPAPGTPPLDRTVLDDVDLTLARFRERAPATAGPHRHRYQGDD